jgi:hypothetical protein
LTTEEFSALNPGDTVHFVAGRDRVTVMGVVVRKREPCSVCIRRLGHDINGKSHRPSWRDKWNVSIAPGHSRVTANIFADFLEECGEARAAEKLRAAFPIEDGAEMTT